MCGVGGGGGKSLPVPTSLSHVEMRLGAGGVFKPLPVPTLVPTSLSHVEMQERKKGRKNNLLSFFTQQTVILQMSVERRKDLPQREGDVEGNEEPTNN